MALETITRREFLKYSAVAAAFLRLLSNITSSETKAKTTYSFPGFKLKIVEWVPEDVTDRITAALGGKDIFSFHSSDPTWPYSPSEDKRWDMGSALYADDGRIVLYIRDIIKSRPTNYLFDRKQKRVYYCHSGDVEAGLSQAAVSKVSGWNIFDNGVILYEIGGNDFNTDTHVAVIADIGNRQKVHIVPDPPPESKYYVMYHDKISLSKDGNAFYLNDFGNNQFTLLNLKDFSVKASGRGGIEGISFDGSFLVIHRGYNYSRLDVKNNKKTSMFYQNLTKHAFQLSPDGKFCVGTVEHFGPQTMEVWGENLQRNIHINPPKGFSKVAERIDNKGTITTINGTYRLEGDTYRWESPKK